MDVQVFITNMPKLDCSRCPQGYFQLEEHLVKHHPEKMRYNLKEARKSPWESMVCFHTIFCFPVLFTAICTSFPYILLFFQFFCRIHHLQGLPLVARCGMSESIQDCTPGTARLLVLLRASFARSSQSPALLKTAALRESFFS